MHAGGTGFVWCDANRCVCTGGEDPNCYILGGRVPIFLIRGAKKKLR